VRPAAASAPRRLLAAAADARLRRARPRLQRNPPPRWGRWGTRTQPARHRPLRRGGRPPALPRPCRGGRLRGRGTGPWPPTAARAAAPAPPRCAAAAAPGPPAGNPAVPAWGVRRLGATARGRAGRGEWAGRVGGDGVRCGARMACLSLLSLDAVLLDHRFEVLGEERAQRFSRGADIVGVGGGRRSAAHLTVTVLNFGAVDPPTRSFDFASPLPAFLPRRILCGESHSTILSLDSEVLDIGPVARTRILIYCLIVRSSEQKFVVAGVLLVKISTVGRWLNLCA
jgi:hypothetical protein